MKQIKIECKECFGSGIFVGMAEREGAGVICYKCKGTGRVEFTYEEFTARKIRSDIERVYKSSYGYCISAKDSKYIQFSKYGCTYQEWTDGKEPKHIEELYCPYIAYNNGIGSEPCTRCRRGELGGKISDCVYYSDKQRCWQEYNSKKD